MKNETYTERLSRWANQLNSWEWPRDLPGKPEGFESLPVIIKKGEPWTNNQYELIKGLLHGIDSIIGHKEVLRWHHLHNLHRTDEEFEKWWAVSYKQGLGEE